MSGAGVVDRRRPFDSRQNYILPGVMSGKSFSGTRLELRVGRAARDGNQCWNALWGANVDSTPARISG